jgi:hypothetical protein
MGKAGLKLVIADLVIAGVALGARAAATHKGNGYAIALFPQGNVLSDSLNNSCQLVPGNMGKPDIRIMAHPAMPIAAAHSRCHYLDDNTMGLWRWIGDTHNSRRFREGFIEDGFHHGLPLQYPACR